MQTMVPLLRGMIVALSLLCSVFFLRFYKTTRDRFFAIFSAAFVIFGLSWFAASALARQLARQDDYRTWAYVGRLGAFVLILVAIVDKNRRGNGTARSRR